MAPPSQSWFLSSLVVLITAWTTSVAAQGFVHLPLIHSTNERYFGKRAVELPLKNRTDVAYYAQLEIGTPPQSQYVQLDTGSFELWVNPECSSITGNDAAFCRTVGTFSTAQSSTARNLGTSKTLKYGIGSANITYFTDTIGLPGSASRMTAVQFGVATSTEDQFAGILGIGYGNGITLRYNNFVDALYAQNVTKVKAYTLALGSKNAMEGVIVFGGVDMSKFGGKLAGQPIIPAASSPDKVPRFWITMQGMSLSAPGSTTPKVYANSSMPVFLDSGSTMTLLPEQLVDSIATDFGATAADSNGFYAVDCLYARLNGTVNFAFNGMTIKVPYNELIREVATSPPSCFLGIQSGDSFTLLGDTFMRSAYTVVDMDSNTVWLAQARQCGTTPAALADSSVLATVTGNCAVGVKDSTGDATPIGSSAGGSASSGATTAKTTATATAVSPASATSKATSTCPAGGCVETFGSSATRVGQGNWGVIAGIVTTIAFGYGLRPPNI